MADRYWVGGTGTWNTVSTANWSDTSGGGSGASVPTVADSVFFDQAGTYTVTMTGALACLDITVSAGTVTFATGTGPTLNVRGSMDLLAGTVWSSTGAITFSSTTTGRTVTTNGVTISGQIVFNGVGGGWTLGSALTTTSGPALIISAGTFDTSSVGNYAVTCSAINFASSTARVINLNNSTITCTANGNAVECSIFTNLTFNAGTSQFVCSGTSATIGVGLAGLTFWNFLFSSTAAGTRFIGGANRFNNLAVTGPASAGVAAVAIESQQTINGTLSTTGTAGNRRVFFASATYGISVDLVVNSAPSLTDADFRGLYVRGTAAPISGTRIGNRGECRGITFDAPKTVFLVGSGSQNFANDVWAQTSGGSSSLVYYPLAQDTAVIDNFVSAGSSITSSNVVGYLPGVDASLRTSPVTISFNDGTTIYGSWTNGSGVGFSGTPFLTFSGGTTQTITSAGKTFTCAITIDTYGGTVQLADALNIGTRTLTVTNGTFTTAGYAVTSGVFSSTNSNIRTINLGASTCSHTSINWSNNTNLTLNAGTSQINITQTNGAFNVSNGTFTFYNVAYSNGTLSLSTFTGTLLTFNNLTFPVPATAGIISVNIASDIVVNGTLTCAGASAVRRVFLQSGRGIGFGINITAAAISADDCDFRDINLAGAASGASPTRAGDCGGNTGITFPAPKTVYWNQGGSAQWSETGWAASSGGAPAVNNFPLAQDTAVFDNAGTADTVSVNARWNIGTFDASLRTSAMTFTGNNNPSIYGDWKFGTGVTSAVTSGMTLLFAKNGTQTITSNGVQFGCLITIENPFANVQLADALSLNSARTLTLSAGTFDAVTYNVTTGLFANFSSNNILRMGSGTWTLSGTGIVWNGLGTIFVGTSNIVLSDTSTAARTFNGNGYYYNKLTIGGATGTSTLSIPGANTFGELASTKTVAHTILIQSNQTTTVGKWSITGTAGNVVTVNGTGTAGTSFTLSIAGPANSGIDYLSVRDCTVLTTSPGEFYVGANSTNVSNNTRVIFTATPAPRTLYWVGGTGNWSSTTKWDTTSGGGGGAAIPTSLDAVNFDALSNATAYTATIDAGVTLARCASFTMAGPASGNVTFAGTQGIAFHGDVSFSATGITRTYAGTMFWAGNSSYTFTTNGLTLASNCTVIGVGSTWTLGSALNIGSLSLTITYGTFSTSVSNYTLTSAGLSLNNSNVRSLSLNGSTVTLSAISLSSFNAISVANLTFNAGTSQINLSGSDAGIACGGLTFNNVSFTSGAIGGRSITGVNTFNTLSFAGNVQTGVIAASINANQTISTLTLNAGTASAFRTFLASNTIGTPRTLTVGTLTAGAADIDFRDITIAGAAAPISGTRFGDAKGNSGITFDAAKTVFYRQTGSANWGATGSGSWSETSGSALDATKFPLAQDTAVFPAATYPSSGSTTTINAAYNIGTIDMSLRTTNTMTLATGSTTPAIYGNWINGTGTTLTGTGNMTFAGRTTQQITSAGRTFTQDMSFWTPGGSINLLDAYTNNRLSGTAIQHIAGTFDANGYNVTLSSGGFFSNSSFPRTAAISSGTWVLGANGSAWTGNATGLTVTGTGAISLTNASAKQFTGGGISYSGITLNQGGAGALTITGNNTFKTITNTYSATGATSITLLSNTTQTLTSPWTATGEAGRVLTVGGTSAAIPATLVFTGAVAAADVDYLAINNVRAYDIFDKWYAGPNSTNGGSLGWYFIVKPSGIVYFVTISETSFSSDAVQAAQISLSSILETIQSADFPEARLVLPSSTSESAQTLDQITAQPTLSSVVSDSAQALDATAAQASLSSVTSEFAQASDVTAAQANLNSAASESAQALDQTDAKAVLLSNAQEYAQVDDLPFAQVDVLSAVDETAQIDDASSAVVDFSSAVSEDGQALDTLNASADLNAAASEDAQALDTTDAQMDMFPSVDEAAQGNDLTSATAEFGVLVFEDGQALDDIAAVAAFGSSASETASVLDQASVSLDLGSAVSEDAQISDASSGAASFGGEVSETNNASDSSSASGVLQVSVSDTAQVSDENASQVVFSLSLSETFQALDQVSSSASFASEASETARAQDQVLVDASIFGASTNDTANASDVINSQAVFPGSIDETVASSDSALAAQLFVTTLLESSQTLDSVSASQRFASRVSETATALDQVAVDASVFGASTAETVRASDQASSLVTVFGSISETATGRDTTVGFLVFPTSVSEAAQVSDQIVGQVLFRASLSEQVNASDTSSSQAVTSANTSESAAASDQAVVGPSVFGAATAETGQVADQPQSQAEFGGVIDEAATEADNASGALVLPGSTTEAAQIADESSSSQTFAVDTAETVSAADDLQAFTVLQSAASESAQPSDQSLAVVAFGGTVVEEVGALDQVQTQAEFGSLINETAMSADSTVAAMIALGNVAETAQAIEAFLSNQTFPVSTNEAVSAADVLQALATFQTAVNETGQASDQTSTVVVFVGSVAEQVGVSDLAIVAASIFNAALQDEARARDTVNAPGSVYNPAVADTAQAQDDASSAVVISRTASETISASDENNAAFTAASQINESATAVDVAAALAAFVARTEESASASDVNLVAPSIFNAIALASARVFDRPDPSGSIFNVSMTESVTMLDSLIGGFLWNLIDDIQNADWQNVGNAQGTEWTQINTDDNPNWQPLPPP